MNPDDEYQTWLAARRGESPPSGLTDQIMSAVRESDQQATTSLQPKSARKMAWQRAVQYLACSAAALVLAVRLYSFVSVFVVVSSETEIAVTEPVEEFSNVNKP